MKRLKKAVIICLCFYLFLFVFDLDDKLYSRAIDILNEYKGIKSLSLDKYRVKIDAKKIKGIEDNLSDITYSSTSKTLFCILNSPRKIYELSLNGDVIRTINLNGFKDTEGITFLYKNTFAICDERLQEFFIITIKKDTKQINKKDIIQRFKLDNGSFKNFGYEGIAYNKNNNEFYLVNEKFPTQVITISNWLNKNSISISFKNQFSSIANSVSDLSGVHYNPTNNHLLFLSDESMLLTEVTMQGEQISFMDLEKDFVGLKRDIPQAEGITMDEENNIYIVSEPNLFYKLTKEKR